MHAAISSLSAETGLSFHGQIAGRKSGRTTAGGGAIAKTAELGTAAATPPELAAVADVIYVSDSTPGIRRRLRRGKFLYLDPDGRPIRDRQEIARINKLAIPPAYRDVWICPDPRGHLQATGRDVRGRKQYRYHPRWIEIRDAQKYDRLLSFAAALPRIRAAVETHLAEPGLGRDKVMATVVALLDRTLIRVGNPRYVRENQSFGLTTLRNRHVAVEGSAIRFHFRGKSGIEHQVSVSHPRLARILKRCQELPGQQLFQYLDPEGRPRTVTSQDVNDYLRDWGKGDFTAKDYRTWAASALALEYFRKLRGTDPEDAKTRVTEVVARVAKQLGNTPAICRKCYIHPGLIESFVAGELAGLRRSRRLTRLRSEEVALRKFLEMR